MRTASLKVCAYLQGAIVLGMMMAAQLAPPAYGTMLLVSTTGQSTAAILDHARAAGALPVGGGPVTASLVVLGDRSRVLAKTLPVGIIAIAAPAMICGNEGR